eukprot:GEZU01024212.1.p1 GENE.GEZU01024212.1~~GEZU01024212.1.p1  ORF type:complete len:270 (-),score=24.19 GEZU01024212.1:58-867(-)
MYLRLLRASAVLHATTRRQKRIDLWVGTISYHIYYTCIHAHIPFSSRPKAWFLYLSNRAYGVHPHHASEYDDKVEARIKKLLEHPRSVAWGEIGLDYLRDISPRTTQRAVFERQLRAAVALQKPIVIHTREADHDTFDILKANVPSDWPVHVHCFTDDPQFAADLLSNFSNLYLGFTGVATFDPRPTTPPADYNQGRNARVHESIRITPLNRLLLETDGPWLRPRQTKCSIAHSGLIPLIAQKIASIKQVPVNKVMQAARQNTKNMYGV